MNVLPSLERRRSGFTLVEIMIVVLIIGILLAIAVPSFVSARESARAKSCVDNLSKLSTATQQYVMDNKLPSTATLTTAQFQGLAPTYVRSFPLPGEWQLLPRRDGGGQPVLRRQRHRRGTLRERPRRLRAADGARLDERRGPILPRPAVRRGIPEYRKAIPPPNALGRPDGSAASRSWRWCWR